MKKIALFIIASVFTFAVSAQSGTTKETKAAPAKEEKAKPAKEEKAKPAKTKKTAKAKQDKAETKADATKK
jgi:hypothetical protein